MEISLNQSLTQAFTTFTKMIRDVTDKDVKDKTAIGKGSSRHCYQNTVKGRQGDNINQKDIFLHICRFVQ